jgi:hypothetical protein
MRKLRRTESIMRALAAGRWALRKLLGAARTAILFAVVLIALPFFFLASVLGEHVLLRRART